MGNLMCLHRAVVRGHLGVNIRHCARADANLHRQTVNRACDTDIRRKVRMRARRDWVAYLHIVLFGKRVLAVGCVSTAAQVPELREDVAAFLMHRVSYATPRRDLGIRPNAYMKP